MPKMEPAVPSPRALPFRAGPYECYHYLGGNLAEVYLARDLRTGFNRAVKVLGGGYGVGSELMQRFVAEGRAALQCSHPNIVMTYEAEQAEGLAYIAMEQLQGATLKTLLERGELRAVPELIPIAWQVACGLLYLHQRSIIHRDIKPENVHIEPSGHAKIFDFGVARQKDQQITREGQLVGTPLYMAPEQVRHEPVTAASDVYSFGVLLFVMFTGRFPIRGVSREELFAAVVFYPPDLSPLEGKGIPPAVVELITQCLHKQPELRPASFAEIEARLRSMVSIPVTVPGVARVPGVPRVPEGRAPRGRFNWPLLLLGMLLLAGAGLGATWFMNRPKPVETRVLTKGVYMLLVPAGPARLGGERRTVQVGGFYIDRTEVSNEAYREFSTATHRELPSSSRELPANFPIVNVAYEDAVAFCAWADKRLPTDVEWEKAARGEEGRLYPWGEEPRVDLANVPHGNEPHEIQPVESNLSGASPYGAINMLGNVWEWVEKPEQLELGDLREFVLDPPATREERAVQMRGGSFQHGIDLGRAVWDFAVAPARLKRGDVGFRCAHNL